jgi:hypothetical protein
VQVIGTQTAYSINGISLPRYRQAAILILQRKIDLGEVRNFGDPPRFARSWQDREVTTWMWMPYAKYSQSWLSFSSGLIIV